MGGIVDAIFGGGDTPQVVQRDPAAEQRKADEEAAKKANAERVALKRSKTGSSLLSTGAGDGEAMTSSALASGKKTLGQ